MFFRSARLTVKTKWLSEYKNGGSRSWRHFIPNDAPPNVGTSYLTHLIALLFISPKTVDKHRTSLMTKLHVHSLVELLAYALREGLIDPANISGQS